MSLRNIWRLTLITGSCIRATRGMASTDLEDGYCMLDPIKVSVITPGVAENGGLDKWGIPATLVTTYLHCRGIEVEKTTDFTILFLFSIGITKGKWGTLLNALLDFKRNYDRNTPLAEVLPSLISAHPKRYRALGLRDLSDQMFVQLKETEQTHWLAKAFSTLPSPVMTPNAAYQKLIRGQIEHVSLRGTCQPRACHQRRAVSPGHSHAHAWRSHRSCEWPLLKLSASALLVGPPVPGLWPRYPRGGKPGRSLQRSMS